MRWRRHRQPPVQQCKAATVDHGTADIGICGREGDNAGGVAREVADDDAAGPGIGATATRAALIGDHAGDGGHLPGGRGDVDRL